MQVLSGLAPKNEMTIFDIFWKTYVDRRDSNIISIPNAAVTKKKKKKES